MKKIIVSILIIGLLSITSIASMNAFNVGSATAGEEIKGTHILPSYWNWGDMGGLDWTTPAKNQRRCPVCDVFAVIGALESVIKIREGCADFNPDLSEQYVVSCVIDILNHSNSHNYFEKMNGTVFEDCFPYKASFFIPCSKKSSDWKKYFVPSSSVHVETGATKEFIKNKLIEHGPIILWIQCLGVFWNWRPSIGGYLGMWGRSHNSPEDYFSGKLPKFMSGNHALLLVGWKDDSSIKNGGYWVCKNCWGTSWGYDGFFNLEYDDLGSNSGNIAWVDYDPDDFNWPPIGKPTLNGPTHMDANVEYEFNFSSIDPEGDQIYYKLSWGDGSESDWLGPFESGGIVIVKHTWDKKGSYKVRIKARNENGPESNWMSENQIKRSR